MSEIKFKTFAACDAEIERLNALVAMQKKDMKQAMDEIGRLTAELQVANTVGEALLEHSDTVEADNLRLQAKLDRINQWCLAYPRTVFIEPTKEQWAEANKVLEAHRPACPSLTAISGSNMRHVVEGIQALAATKQGETDE